jgi:uncharacterized Zn finger protein
MSTIPTLDERDIRSFAGEHNLLNGKKYVREGAIFDARQHNMTLRASCKGSQGETYRAQVTFDDQDIDETYCSCPVGNQGHCKHIAGLLWAWHERPGMFIEMDKVESALTDLNKAELISLMKQMLQLHPDLEGLVEKIGPRSSAAPKQKRVPFNRELYRRQVDEIFRTTDRNKWGSEARAAEPLLRIQSIADDYAKQKNYDDAASIYEIIVKGILDNYDTFRWHADEGDLDDVVSDCVDELGTCLKAAHDEKLREQIIQLLYTVYEFDEGLYNDEPVMSERIPALLVRYTTPEERQMLASLVREASENNVDWYADDIDEENFDHFLLGLEADTINDETFLRICRETGSYDYLVERLLKLGQLDEALKAAKYVENYEILEIADILSQHGYNAVAEELIKERTSKSDDTNLLEWLKDRYEDRDDLAATLDAAQRILRVYPHLATIEQYREIRRLAQQLDRWETVQTELLAFLKKSKATSLLIQIALDEAQVDKALELLKSHKRASDSTEGPYGYGLYEVAIDVAKATEDTHPLESIEIYQSYAERLIDQRGRDNYRQACEYLTSMGNIYQKIDQSTVWTDYIMSLREKYKNLPALKDEMARAKL